MTRFEFQKRVFFCLKTCRSHKMVISKDNAYLCLTRGIGHLNAETGGSRHFVMYIGCAEKCKVKAAKLQCDCGWFIRRTNYQEAVTPR